MPKVTYTSEKGLIQEAGTGFVVAPTIGVTNNDFPAAFIPAVTLGNAAAVTSGAIPVTNYMSFISVTGAQAFSLAAGTAAGQLKKIMCNVTNNTGTLTIASPASDTRDVVLFTVVGDTVELIWTGTAWVVLAMYNSATGAITTPTIT